MVARAPGVLLDLLDGDAALGVDGQDAREQVLALRRDGHARGQPVVAAGHPLHHLRARSHALQSGRASGQNRGAPGATCRWDRAWYKLRKVQQ